MALIKCPECKKEISDKATQCIHCGCPIEKEKEKNIVIKDSTKIWLIVCSVVCFLISIYCFIFQIKGILKEQMLLLNFIIEIL